MKITCGTVAQGIEVSLNKYEQINSTCGAVLRHVGCRVCRGTPNQVPEETYQACTATRRHTSHVVNEFGQSLCRLQNNYRRKLVLMHLHAWVYICRFLFVLGGGTKGQGYRRWTIKLKWCIQGLVLVSPKHPQVTFGLSSISFLFPLKVFTSSPFLHCFLSPSPFHPCFPFSPSSMLGTWPGEASIPNIEEGGGR